MNEELKCERKKINKIDKKIAKLFEKRMKSVTKIKKIKKESNISLEDKDRENILIGNNAKLIKDEYKEYYKELEKKIIELSKEYQKKD